ncbi:MAG: MATE family efflux transporter [Cellulosilyticaceae bacterium]
MNNEALLNDDPKSLFFKYLGATVFANLTHAIYVLVDLLCVGVGVGSDALAAMNIALPIFTIYTSIALCIGVGGAATMSLLVGKGEKEKSSRIFTLASWTVIVIGVLLGVGMTAVVTPFSRMLGATEDILPLVRSYLVPVMLTNVFFMYSHMLQVFLRNDHNPKLSMVASIIGSVLNIVFDILLIFVWDMGIVGAALPTAFSPIIVIVIMLLHFKKPECTLRWEKTFWSWEDLCIIIKNGMGVFLLEMMAGVSIFIFNIVLMKNYGMMSVAVYAVMANVVYVAKSIYNGVAQAAQPIISLNEGAGQCDRAFRVTHIAAGTALVIGILSYGVMYMFPETVMRTFTTDQDIITYGAPYLKDYFICLLFAGLNTVMMYYFQATERPGLSMVTSLCKGFVFVVLGLIVLMPLRELQGVYLATGFAEAVTFVVIGGVYGYIYICNKRRSGVKS